MSIQDFFFNLSIYPNLWNVWSYTYFSSADVFISFSFLSKTCKYSTYFNKGHIQFSIWLRLLHISCQVQKCTCLYHFIQFYELILVWSLNMLKFVRTYMYIFVSSNVYLFKNSKCKYNEIQHYKAYISWFIWFKI